jgi:hypothetical protein
MQKQQETKEYSTPPLIAALSSTHQLPWIAALLSLTCHVAGGPAEGSPV